MKRKFAFLISVLLIGMLLLTPTVSAIEQDDPTPAEPSKGEQEQSSLPVQGGPATGEAPSYEGMVTFDATSGGQGISTKEFKSGDEIIGSQGLYSTGTWIFKRYFVGWSDVKNYASNDGARFYFANQKISDIYPDGLKGGETLYAVFVGGIDVLSMNKTWSIDLNKGQTAETTVSNGDIAKQEGFDESNVDKDAQAYYESGIDKYPVNLSASFEFNKQLQSLVYINPGGILTNSGVWEDGPKYKANYTHVDLHVQLDDRIDVASMLNNISFTSYQFKPSFIMDKDYKPLADISSSLVKGSPTSTFSFDPKGNKYLIFRATVRRDGNPNNDLEATPQDLDRDMILSSGDPDNFTISKETAMELAKSGEKLMFRGYIDGIARAATINQAIPKTESKNLTIGFAFHQVTFDKNTGAEGDETISTIQAVHKNSVDNDELTDQSMPTVPVRDPNADGTEYIFKEWNTAPDGDGTTFTGTAPVTSDMKLYAIWIAEEQETAADPDPEITPTEPTEDPKAAAAMPEDPKAGGVAGKGMPKTGEEDNRSLWVMSFLLAGALMWIAGRKPFIQQD